MAANTDYITRANAAALVSEEMSRIVYAELPKKSAAMQLMRIIPMGKTISRLPVSSALATASWLSPTAYTPGTASNATWENKTVTAEELMTIVPIPRAVFEDSDFDMAAQIVPQALTAMGAAIDAAVLFGTNAPTSFATSIYESTDTDVEATSGFALTHDATSGFDVEMSDLMAKPEAAGYEVNGFICAPATKATLRALRDSAGQPIFQPSLIAGTPATLYGEPIIYCANGAWNATSATIMCGDWTQGILGLRQDVQVRIFEEGVISDSGSVTSNLMQADMVAVRITMRVGFAVANPITVTGGSYGSQYPWATMHPTGWS